MVLFFLFIHTLFADLNFLPNASSIYGDELRTFGYVARTVVYWVLYLQGYQKMLDKLNLKRDKIVDIQKALKSADINDDKQVDFDEWRQDLKA